jgi:hypothetical protein
MSFRTVPERVPWQQTVNGFGRESRSKGSGMLIRSEKYGIFGGAAHAVCPAAIPAASMPTQLLGGLLLLIGP